MLAELDLGLLERLIYDENEAIRRLMPYKLKDQFAFKTEEALQYLVLKEVITL